MFKNHGKRLILLGMCLSMAMVSGMTLAEMPQEIIESAAAVFEAPAGRESPFAGMFSNNAAEEITADAPGAETMENTDAGLMEMLAEAPAAQAEVLSDTSLSLQMEAAAESVPEEESWTDLAAATANVEATEAAAAEATDVLAKVDYSTENTTRGFVYRLYKTVLNREPDATGLAFWTSKLDSGEYTAATAIEGFFNSDEYQSSGKSNEEILTDCYQTLLNREPDTTGYDFWIKRLDVGMTSQTILQGFVQSNEFTALAQKYGLVRGDIAVTSPLDMNYDRTYFVYRMYKNCLGREPDKSGETFWCANLANGMTGVQVASGFFFSDEFNNYRYDNPEFVALLYEAILGRKYDENGLASWTDKLNYTDTREKVLNGFITSTEFAEQCAKAQISAGTPLATPDDTVTWQNNITVLQLCNNYRRIAGLYDLYTREDLLWDLAMLRTGEITELFAHSRPDGTSCFSLFEEQGFYGYLGENIAGGQRTAAEVVEAWMNSAGHRANILNSDYTYLATGYLYDPGATTYCAEGKYAGQYVSFRQYWVQNFCNYGVNINK